MTKPQSTVRQSKSAVMLPPDALGVAVVGNRVMITVALTIAGALAFREKLGKVLGDAG